MSWKTPETLWPSMIHRHLSILLCSNEAMLSVPFNKYERSLSFDGGLWIAGMGFVEWGKKHGPNHSLKKLNPIYQGSGYRRESQTELDSWCIIIKARRPLYHNGIDPDKTSHLRTGSFQSVVSHAWFGSCLGFYSWKDSMQHERVHPRCIISYFECSLYGFICSWDLAKA